MSLITAPEDVHDAVLGILREEPGITAAVLIERARRQGISGSRVHRTIWDLIRRDEIRLLDDRTLQAAQ